MSVALLKPDETIPDLVGDILRAAGHDVALARDEQLGGVEDERVLAAAVREMRTFVTFDLHFSDVRRHPPAGTPGIVVLRLPDHALDRVRRVVQRKLKALDAAARLEDLTIPAGNRLEALKGDQAGRYSIRVNDQILQEFLKPVGLGRMEAARRLDVSLNRLNGIVLGKRGVTADTALRLARLRKMSPQFWMRLRADWDLHEAIERERRRVS